MKQVRVIVPPDELPVTLAEVKTDARVDHDDDDALLTSLMVAATDRAEEFARRAFVTRTCELALDGWPCGGTIALPLPPLVEVLKVEYFDMANERHDVPAGDYLVVADLEPGLVTPVYNKTWPAVDLRLISPIRVTYRAGYGAAAAVPERYKHLIRALVAIDYEYREGLTADGQRKAAFVQARLQSDWGW